MRGLNALIATVSTPIAAPVITTTRLRGGNAASARGAASLVAEAISTARAAGITGLIVVRVDSAFYNGAFVAACRRNGAHFSVTVRMDPKIRRAIAAIDEDAWTAIAYPNAVFDEQAGQWISDAEIAEVPYTAFTSTPAHATEGRLIVRRVRDLAKSPAGHGQGELLAAHRYHAVFTNSPFQLVQAESQHRAHAIIEQVFADLFAGHSPIYLRASSMPMPPGWPWPPPPTRSPAPGCVGLTRTRLARGATIRTQLINVAARPPAPDVTRSPGTYPATGPGNNTGSTPFTPPTADHQRWPPERKPRSVTARPDQTALLQGPIPTGQAGRRGQQLKRATTQRPQLNPVANRHTKYIGGFRLS
ncbi:putative tnpC, partial [Mycobacterium kansasii 732]